MINRLKGIETPRSTSGQRSVSQGEPSHGTHLAMVTRWSGDIFPTSLQKILTASKGFGQHSHRCALANSAHMLLSVAAVTKTNVMITGDLRNVSAAFVWECFRKGVREESAVRQS